MAYMKGGKIVRPGTPGAVLVEADMEDIHVDFLSLVDRGANGKEWLLLKRREPEEENVASEELVERVTNRVLKSFGLDGDDEEAGGDGDQEGADEAAATEAAAEAGDEGNGTEGAEGETEEGGESESDDAEDEAASAEDAGDGTGEAAAAAEDTDDTEASVEEEATGEAEKALTDEQILQDILMAQVSGVSKGGHLAALVKRLKPDERVPVKRLRAAAVLDGVDF